MRTAIDYPAPGSCSYQYAGRVLCWCCDDDEFSSTCWSTCLYGVADAYQRQVKAISTATLQKNIRLSPQFAMTATGVRHHSNTSQGTSSGWCMADDDYHLLVLPTFSAPYNPKRTSS